MRPASEARVIQIRTARSTSLPVVVTYEPAEDPSCRWQTTCHEHGNCVGHKTRALAVSWAARPEEWCEDCTALIERGRS